MARMKVTHDNLRIEVEPGEIEAYALGAIEVLRKRYGQKVHFLREGEHAFSKVLEFARSVADVTVFESNTWPTDHFRNVARVVEQKGDLYVVPPGPGRALRGAVRKLSVEIKAAAARHLAKGEERA
jgi:hypothetical protein